MENTLVSVCLITYNHVKYIEQCIESVLNQKVDFPWEIIIADDCSQDGTTEIIRKYSDLYPTLIRPIIRQKNVGAANNFIELLQSANGKYIAYMECDDFWTDSFKLKKQINFLEKNPDYSTCFHNTEERFEGNSERESILYLNSTKKTEFELEDLFDGNMIPSCSIVFKNTLRGQFPEWYKKLKLGDWTLHILNAQSGKLKYIPQVMGVHRRHEKGTWSALSNDIIIKYTLEVFDALIAYFEKDEVKKLMITKAKNKFRSKHVKYKFIKRVINKIKREVQKHLQ